MCRTIISYKHQMPFTKNSQIRCGMKNQKKVRSERRHSFPVFIGPYLMSVVIIQMEYVTVTGKGDFLCCRSLCLTLWAFEPRMRWIKMVKLKKQNPNRNGGNWKKGKWKMNWYFRFVTFDAWHWPQETTFIVFVFSICRCKHNKFP